MHSPGGQQPEHPPLPVKQGWVLVPMLSTAEVFRYRASVYFAIKPCNATHSLVGKETPDPKMHPMPSPFPSER